jgi:hypothetical protein
MRGSRKTQTSGCHNAYIISPIARFRTFHSSKITLRLDVASAVASALPETLKSKVFPCLLRFCQSADKPNRTEILLIVMRALPFILRVGAFTAAILMLAITFAFVQQASDESKWIADWNGHQKLTWQQWAAEARQFPLWHPRHWGRRFTEADARSI